MIRRLVLPALLATLLSLAVSPAASAEGALPSPCAGDAGRGTLTQQVATTPQGSMTYSVWVPAQLGPNPGVMVHLHGANEDVRKVMCESRLNEVASDRGFVAVYPQEDPGNGSAGMWNWGQEAAAGRSGRASTLIATIARQVVDEQHADPSEVFVSGISAGGGMAVVAAVTYPDVFQGVAVEVGCMYAGLQCNPTTPYPDSTLDPAVSALTAYREMGPRAHRIPMIVSYGSLDPLAALTDQTKLIQQWLGTDDWIDDGQADGSVPQTAAASHQGSADGADYTVTDWDDAQGCPLVQRYVIDLMGHAYAGGAPLDPTDLVAFPHGPDMRDVGWQYLSAAARGGCG